MIAVRSYRAGLEAGDDALVAQARAVLAAAGVEPPDAALLALADAVRERNPAGQRAALTRLAAGPLDLLVPPMRAWLALDGDPKRALALAEAIPERSLGGGALGQNRILLLFAAGDPARGQAALERARADDLAGDDLARDVARVATARVDAAFGIARLLTGLATELADEEDAVPLRIVLARAALRLDPGDDRARIILARAIAVGGGVDGALAVLDTVPIASPLADTAGLTRIAVLRRAGRVDEALAIARQRPGADELVADLLSAGGRDAEAAAIYRRVITAAGDRASWTLYLRAGGALDRAGRWAEARPLIEKAVALAPDQPVALNYLGYGQLENGGDLAAARALIERAAQLRPGDSSIRDSLGWVYARGGDHARALPLLERAAAEAPDNATIAEHLGDTYWRLGRRFEARYAWAAAEAIADAGDRARLAGKIADGIADR